MIKKTKEIVILVLVLIGAFFLYMIDKRNLSLYFISAYSRFTEGNLIDIGNLEFELQDPWYIKDKKIDVIKIFRLPDSQGNHIVGIFELINPDEIRNEINSGYLSNVKYGNYQAYKTEMSMKCSGIETECRHTILIIPEINLKITISNYLPNQNDAVSEISNLILN